MFEHDEEMHIPIIESKKTDNDLLVKYDIDCDLDDELKGLTENDLDTDTEEEEMNMPIIDLDDEVNELAEQQLDMDTDNNERTKHLDKINKLIDHVNLLARIKNDFSTNVNRICVLMNKLHDEIYGDDSWLMLVKLNKINTLLEESLDYVWKMIYGENREKHEKINIDKHKDIVGYVSKYIDIVNDKLELVKVIGKLLDGVINDVQNEADMINDMKQACEIDIDILKSIHNTLARILECWRDGYLLTRSGLC